MEMHDAQEELYRIKSRDREVKSVSADLRRIRYENHFSQKIRASMGGSIS